MAILNNQSIVIDAILTKLGRSKLAMNDGSFKITQFALSDDEIDYTLYNPSHPSGSAFFGEAIENTPLLEGLPDENQMMKYKLVTLPRGTSKLPVISLGYNTVNLKQGSSITIAPQTLNYLGNTSTFEANGYILTVGDSRLLSSFVGNGGNDTSNLNSISISTGTKLSKTKTGTSFTLQGTTLNTLFDESSNTLSTTITAIGKDSGARITIPLIITKNT